MERAGRALARDIIATGKAFTTHRTHTKTEHASNPYLVPISYFEGTDKWGASAALWLDSQASSLQTVYARGSANVTYSYKGNSMGDCGCFTPDTRVSTLKNGEVHHAPISTLKEGDTIICQDGHIGGENLPTCSHHAF